MQCTELTTVLVTAFDSILELNSDAITCQLISAMTAVWTVAPHTMIPYSNHILKVLLSNTHRTGSSQSTTTFPCSVDDSSNSRSTAEVLSAIPRLLMLQFMETATSVLCVQDAECWDTTCVPVLQQLLTLVSKPTTTSRSSKSVPRKVTADTVSNDERSHAWQALCVMTKPLLDRLATVLVSVTSTTTTPCEVLVQSLANAVIAANRDTSMPKLRQSQECIGALLLLHKPALFLPLFKAEMSDHNLKAQAASSLLIMLGYALHVSQETHTELTAALLHDTNSVHELLSTLLPWLGAAHSFTRVVAQLVSHRLLSDTTFLTTKATAAVDSSSNDQLTQFWAQQARFLRENQEVIDMRRKQQDTFESLRLFKQCSVSGLVELYGIDDRGEIQSQHISESVKQSLLEMITSTNSSTDESTTNSGDISDGSNGHVISLTDSSNGADAVDDINVSTLQRKILTPWSQLQLTAPDTLIADNYSYNDNDNSSNSNSSDSKRNAECMSRQPFILCASLVSNSINIGGIARTCEIFSCQCLLVNDAKIVDKADFRSLSLSAAQWLPIQECTAKSLPQRIAAAKEQGYWYVRHSTNTSIFLYIVNAVL
eukprot:11856-Heterococcus_DN1.PRE.2